MGGECGVNGEFLLRNTEETRNCLEQIEENGLDNFVWTFRIKDVPDINSILGLRGEGLEQAAVTAQLMTVGDASSGHFIRLLDCVGSLKSLVLTPATIRIWDDVDGSRSIYIGHKDGQKNTQRRRRLQRIKEAFDNLDAATRREFLSYANAEKKDTVNEGPARSWQVRGCRSTDIRRYVTLGQVDAPGAEDALKRAMAAFPDCFNITVGSAV
jgi:hypothetical protein